MQNFVFHNPTKILFGRGTIAASAQEICQLGRNVLLLHGRNHAQKSGLLDTILQQLHGAGAEVITVGGVTPNPTLEHVHRAINAAKSNGIEVVCGLGGGSVIDSAKAVAAGALVEHDVWKFFTGKKSIKKALPVVAISTMAASGSEMNSGMVLTNGASQHKFGFAHRLLYPKVAIMDPQTTYSVPKEYTAFGAIDALAHLMEFYLTSTGSGAMVQERYMAGLAQSIVQSCKAALIKPTDYEARAALMWASALALNGLSAAGLGKISFPMHLIEHSLSALYDIPHGAGLALVIPGWLRFHANSIPERITAFLAQVFEASFAGKEAVDTAIDRYLQWLGDLGVPTSLGDFGVSAADFDRLAQNALPLAKVWRMREYDQEMITAILRCCTP